MKNLQGLRKRAREACKARKHDMKPLRITGWTEMRGFTAASRCKKCYAYVQIIERPLPNEIDIGGSAVGTNCGGKND